MTAAARVPDRRELLARCFTDFPSFCALLRVTPLQIEPGAPRPRIPMRLTWIQKRICAERTSRIVILKPRRVYVTTLEVAYDLFWFFTVRGARVFIVCQTTEDHAVRDEIAEIVRTLLESLREHARVDLDVENAKNLAWYGHDARLRIIEAGASLETARGRGRGVTVNRLHATELASWRYGTETLTVLLNSMPQDPRYGSVTIESTPRGVGGPYHEMWQKAVAGDGDFRALFFPWYEHEEYRRPLAPGEVVYAETDEEEKLAELGVCAEALKWRRAEIATQSADVIAQEYPNDPHSCFLLSGREFFDAPTTLRLLARAAEPIRREPLRGSGVLAELRVWDEPDPFSQYVIAADTSEGGGAPVAAGSPRRGAGDASAAVVREVGTAREVAKVVGHVKPGEFAVILARLGRAYNSALVVVERNGPGLATLDRLGNVIRYPRIYEGRDGKPGWHTNVASRPAALAGLEQAHRDGSWESADRETLEQMQFFVWREKPGGTSKAEAAPGEHDDIIMAEAICLDVLRHPIRAPRRDVRNLPAR